MVCRLTMVGAALLLLALSVHGLTLKEMMDRDIEEKGSAAVGIKKTTGKPHKHAATTEAPKKKHDKKHNKKHDKAKDPHTTPLPSGTNAKPKKAAPAFAAAHQAPMMASGGGSASSGGAALGTSAMVGIGVGVGVACLVAVGSVIGILVMVRRRKGKGAPLEKQKTYGGTE